MLGLHFETCNEFGLSFSFENCQLNHSTFYQTKIKNTIFRNCQLEETDFTEADLTHSVFDQCNLLHAVFYSTVLEKCDLRSAFHYAIDPELNKITKAKFSASGLAGLLNKYNIDIEY
jgi:uncharacterized protein YjbI with pentapeptide repeats